MCSVGSVVHVVLVLFVLSSFKSSGAADVDTRISSFHNFMCGCVHAQQAYKSCTLRYRIDLRKAAAGDCETLHNNFVCIISAVETSSCSGKEGVLDISKKYMKNVDTKCGASRNASDVETLTQKDTEIISSFQNYMKDCVDAQQTFKSCSLKYHVYLHKAATGDCESLNNIYVCIVSAVNASSCSGKEMSLELSKKFKNAVDTKCSASLNASGNASGNASTLTLMGFCSVIIMACIKVIN